MKQIIIYVCIIIFVLCILYFFYQNSLESFASYNNNEFIKQRLRSRGWDINPISNGYLAINSKNTREMQLICDTGFNGNNGMCCADGKYNSRGVCCDYGSMNDGYGNCIPSSNTATNTLTKFDNDISQSIDIQYHKTEEQLMDEAEITDVTFGNTYVYDENGNKIPYPFSSVQGEITYYTPGSYPFGPANYVPNYENAIYFSKLTGQSTTMPVYNTAKMRGGFCSYFSDQPKEKEIACSQLDPNECASTNCCVLLGGSKCVSGDSAGPTYTTNYGDVFLRNKDYYYYQGICYGNCE
jgi:hypothetical protein